MNNFVCEICECNSMKKVNDTTYACECCGVQYDYAENANSSSYFESQPVAGEKKAERWLRYCGIMGLVPYTFILGIVTPFLINKAKAENGGVLSKKAKRYVIFGLVGFAFWVGALVLMFCSI